MIPFLCRNARIHSRTSGCVVTPSPTFAVAMFGFTIMSAFLLKLKYVTLWHQRWERRWEVPQPPHDTCLSIGCPISSQQKSELTPSTPSFYGGSSGDIYLPALSALQVAFLKTSFKLKR